MKLSRSAFLAFDLVAHAIARAQSGLNDRGISELWVGIEALCRGEDVILADVDGVEVGWERRVGTNHLMKARES